VSVRTRRQALENHDKAHCTQHGKGEIPSFLFFYFYKFNVYKLDANKVAKFLAKLEERISKLEEVRVLEEEEKKPEGEEEKKPEGEAEGEEEKKEE